MSIRRNISKKIDLNFAHPHPDIENNDNDTTNSSEDGIQDTDFGTKLPVRKDEANTFDMTLNVLSDRFENTHLFSDDLYSENDSEIWGSNSSTSDELENDLSEKIQREYEHIDSVLYGEEKISNTDSKYEELELWRNQFPHLRVVGKACKPIYSDTPPDDDFEGEEEIIAEHWDELPSTSKEDDVSPNNIIRGDIKAKVKEAVVNNIMKEMRLRILSKKYLDSTESPIQLPCDSKQPNKNDDALPKNFLMRKDECLSLNSLHLRPRSHYQKTEYANPLMRSHLAAAKWQRNNSPEYGFSSLPHIIPQDNNDNVKAQMSANESGRCSANCRKQSGAVRRSTLPQQKTKNVTLPPIQKISSLPEGDRSAKVISRNLKKRPTSNYNSIPK